MQMFFTKRVRIVCWAGEIDFTPTSPCPGQHPVVTATLGVSGYLGHRAIPEECLSINLEMPSLSLWAHRRWAED